MENNHLVSGDIAEFDEAQFRKEEELGKLRVRHKGSPVKMLVGVLKF